MMSLLSSLQSPSSSLSNNLLSSCNSTICQQVVSDNLVALDKITALLQLVDKLATSLLRTPLVTRLLIASRSKLVKINL